VLWLVVLAFSLLYAYKFGWDGFRLRHPRWHAAFGLGAAACFLVIPLIYLTNTQLMLDRAAWARQPGFFEAMATVGNVFPRYVHFMLACFAITGFWIALWWRRPSLEMEEAARAKVVRTGVLWALLPTACQFVAGPLVLFTLPRGGITPLMVGVLAVGILSGVLAIFAMADTLRGRDQMGRAALFLLVTIVCMGTSRHLIREALLARPADAPLPTSRAGAIVAVTFCEDGRAGYGDGSASGGAPLQAYRGGGLRQPG
jgi:cytochrome c